jgi:acetyl esterase/lipase
MRRKQRWRYRWVWIFIAVACLGFVGIGYGLAVRKPTGIYEVTNGPRRYLDPVFGSYTVQQNIKYGEAMNYKRTGTEKLYLDLYTPVGDAASSRPLIIFIHGGGFYIGDKNIIGGEYGDPNAAFGWGSYFAKRGYVVMSINYRLADHLVKAGDTDAEQIILMSKSDVYAAVRYARLHASAYGVDPNKIVLAGNSAGAVLALYGAYTPNVPGDNVSNPGPSHQVQAAVSLAGAILPGTAATITGSTVPAIMFHGDQDTTVPYTAALGLYQRLVALGTRVDWYVFPGQGHTIAGYAAGAPTVAQFLYEVLHLGSTTVSPSPSIAASHSPSPSPSPRVSASPVASVVPSPSQSVWEVVSPSPSAASPRASTGVRASPVAPIQPKVPSASPQGIQPTPMPDPYVYQDFVWHGGETATIQVQRANVEESSTVPWYTELWEWIVGLFS